MIKLLYCWLLGMAATGLFFSLAILHSYQHMYSIYIGEKSALNIELASARAIRNRRLEPMDEKKVLVAALTLFGSKSSPGECFFDGNTSAQVAVIDSARNRASECGTEWHDEFLKFGYSKKKNRHVAMYSVWENGGPKIGYNDINRFAKAMEKARALINLTENVPPDTRITHYHQRRMKKPPSWREKFTHIKNVGGNSFYQEEGEKDSYCNATIPKRIPIYAKVKAVKKKTVPSKEERLNNLRKIIKEQYVNGRT